MDEYDEMIQSMKGDGPSEVEEEARKKAMTIEEALKDEINRLHSTDASIPARDRIDRIIDLVTDLIAERSEEKAEEVVDKHERDCDHDIWV